MAKAVKTKKVKEVIEEPQVAQMAQTPDSLAEIVENPIIGDEPPSVTLEEVKEVGKVEEVVKVNPEPVSEFRGVVNHQTQDDLPMEQKIEKFLSDKDGYVRANDFLKSLFGIPKFNEPPKWLIQGNSKLLKATLEKMVANNDLTVQDNKHRVLGQSYYPNSATGKQEHRNLNNVEIFIKK